MLNKLITDKPNILQEFEKIRDEAFSIAEEETQLLQLRSERAEVVRLMEQLTAENASVAVDQASYKSRFAQLSERYIRGNDHVATLDEAVRNRQYQKAKTELFIKELRKLDALVTGFSDGMWYSLVDHVMVYNKEDVRFVFKNGMELGQ